MHCRLKGKGDENWPKSYLIGEITNTETKSYFVLSVAHSKIRVIFCIVLFFITTNSFTGNIDFTKKPFKLSLDYYYSHFSCHDTYSKLTDHFKFDIQFALHKLERFRENDFIGYQTRWNLKKTSGKEKLFVLKYIRDVYKLYEQQNPHCEAQSRRRSKGLAFLQIYFLSRIGTLSSSRKAEGHSNKIRS